MTASQFTGGSYKHVDPLNYNSGKSGCEVTIHWCVADGASLDEQTAMGERARVEAIRLALGADKPYQQQIVERPPAEGGAPAAFALAAEASPVPPTQRIIERPQPGTPAVLSAETIKATMDAYHQPSEQAPPAPLALPVLGPISAPAVASPAPPASLSTVTESAPEVITDEQLRDAATHHSQRIMAAAAKDPVSQEQAARKISGLIAQFVVPPKTLYTIDQAQRRQFLDGLAAL